MYKDVKNSIKRLVHNQKQSGRNPLHKAAATTDANLQGYIASMMDPRNLKTMQTLDLNSSHQNIYINSITPRSDNASEKPPKLKRKKVTIIKKKYNRDGSVEKIRQDIYKNYGSMFAKKESQRLGSTLTFHHGS